MLVKGATGGCLNSKTMSYKNIEPHHKIRWYHDCLIFIMGIPIPGKEIFQPKSGPNCFKPRDDWLIAEICHLPMIFIATHFCMIWGLVCHMQVSRAGTGNNCIPQILWDVITCPCTWSACFWLTNPHMMETDLYQSICWQNIDTYQLLMGLAI